MANAKSPLVVMGGNPNLIYESFTENGAYEASDYGADGFAGVIVDVPPTLFRQLVDKSITTVTADDLAGVTIISPRAFNNCHSLVSFEMPNSVKTIDSNAFNFCENLTDLSVSNAVEYIGTYAFANCLVLPSITLPASLTFIAANAFNTCRMFTGITILATTPPSLENTNAFSDTNNCPIYVPAESVSTYQGATNWASFASRIFPLVSTVSDLANIDTTTYTKACVTGVDESYKKYTYDGSQWNEVV